MKLLILFPYQMYTQKVSPVRRWHIDELSRRDDVECLLTGQGWPDYRDDVSLSANIEKLMPDADAILWYKPDGHQKSCIPPLIDSWHRPKADSSPGNIPSIAIYNEAWWPDRRAWNECWQTMTDLIIAHHQKDLKQFHRHPKCQTPGDSYNPKVVHIPHATPVDLFAKYALPWNERDIACTVTGTIGKEFYPLRTRFAHLIASGKLPGLIRSHRGYTLPTLQRCREQEIEYAKWLGRTKIALVCSSCYGYGLAKYVEAAAAGCLVAGDVPIDYEETLGMCMLRIDPKHSDDRLVGQIEGALADDRLTNLAGQRCRRAVVEHHSMTDYVDKLLDAIRGLL